MSIIVITAGGPQEVSEGYLEPVPASAAGILYEYRRALQVLVDGTAQARGYDSGVTCASYLGSTIPSWAAEAVAFVAWRDAVWAHAYAELDKVTTGQRPQPTVAELIAELPVMTWPG